MRLCRCGSERASLSADLAEPDIEHAHDEQHETDADGEQDHGISGSARPVHAFEERAINDLGEPEARRTARRLRRGKAAVVEINALSPARCVAGLGKRIIDPALNFHPGGSKATGVFIWFAVKPLNGIVIREIHERMYAYPRP